MYGNKLIGKSCNIFCDASIDTNHKIACAGAIASDERAMNSISGLRMIQTNATNNSAEILAVGLGIQLAMNIRSNGGQIWEGGYTQFNIYSDSKIALFGIRDWIFNWAKTQSKRDACMFSSSGTPVKNQEYYKAIVKMVVDNNLYVNFFHQRGHINVNSNASLSEAYIDFVKDNRVRPEDLGVNFMQTVVYNNLVDEWSRAGITDPSIPVEMMRPANQLRLSGKDMVTYGKLIKPRYTV